jgi:ribosomal protein L40E
MNFTEAQLELDFIRCRRCGDLDRRDWFMPRMVCRKCGCRSYVNATVVTEEEKARVASGWFEDEANK